MIRWRAAVPRAPRRATGRAIPVATLGRVTGPAVPRITWRPLTPDDFALLGAWLAAPHVRRWWNHESDPQSIDRDFGPTARGEVLAEDLLVSADGDPVGLVQRIRWGDWPDYLDEVRPLAEVPAEAISLDYLIGDPGRVGRGLGSAVLRAMLAATWIDRPSAPAVVIPVAAANSASWRALEKAGMRRVSAGLLPPDNPIDDGWHYLYRLDRPSPGE
ncbi:acetyltransferase (GNAT) domain-containing protein [Nocardia nova SH22a]|uniref:Acetyltransferase (GNAT) domain-containing protein n=1 Tax=Nocardia nova SH22a TaxID=1415166 RepID=W5TLQ9_9NOCA|nr:acetyltransferase (GNAT) domain-containing protein [Nocardia nova SH22a]